MRYGFVLPGGSAAQQVQQAVLAEEAGWDGVFVWEAAYGVDAWTLLAAMSQRTSRVRLATMLTPLPWRRPWKVASQAATLHALSGGRALLAVGLGAVDPALGTTGEPTDRRTRAQRLDEGIDVLRALWSGDLRFQGRHYDVDLRRLGDGMIPPELVPTEVPVWCVGAWPHEKSMRRILRCDGLIPHAEDVTPDVIRQMIAWLDANGGRRSGFDVVQEGETPADDRAKAASIVQPWAEAGCTWWLEARWQASRDDPEEVNARIAAGPPRE